MSANRVVPLSVRIAFGSLLMIASIIGANWSIARSMQYHAQNHVLSPEDYTVVVRPVAAGDSPTARVSDDGKYSVTVVALGTSLAMREITQASVLPFCFSVIGLVAMVITFSRERIWSPRQDVVMN